LLGALLADPFLREYVVPMKNFRNAILVAMHVGLLGNLAVADDWPQWRGPNRDGVWRETGVLERFAGKSLSIQWRAPIGSGYSGPTVANGLVFVTDRQVEPEQIERVHCFDFATGKPRWSFNYPCVYRKVGYSAGPRASVSVDEGKAYSLGTMGHLHCFNAGTGEVLWKHDLDARYHIRMPIWGVSASPLVEGDLLIVQVGGGADAKEGGSEKACIVAFDKWTGEERWKALADNISYSAPIIIEQAGKRVLVCWTGERVVGLDPSSGALLWEDEAAPTKMIISVATPVVDRDRLFTTSFYDGSTLLKLASNETKIERLWRRRGSNEKETDGIHSIISTPVIDGDYIYGVDSYGQLRCLDIRTGDRVWEDLTAVPKARWSTIHFVRHEQQYWMFNERGELIIGELSPRGFTEISRASLIAPTTGQLPERKGVCWSHPAFANRHIIARNDDEIVCASLIPGEN
jgi:outer membrane protein assembly factor BamB